MFRRTTGTALMAAALLVAGCEGGGTGAPALEATVSGPPWMVGAPLAGGGFECDIPLTLTAVGTGRATLSGAALTRYTLTSQITTRPALSEVRALFGGAAGIDAGQTLQGRMRAGGSSTFDVRLQLQYTLEGESGIEVTEVNTTCAQPG